MTLANSEAVLLGVIVGALLKALADYTVRAHAFSLDLRREIQHRLLREHLEEGIKPAREWVVKCQRAEANGGQPPTNDFLNETESVLWKLAMLDTRFGRNWVEKCERIKHLLNCRNTMAQVGCDDAGTKEVKTILRRLNAEFGWYEVWQMRHPDAGGFRICVWSVVAWAKNAIART